MKVREIMTREVTIVSPGDDLRSAAQLMEKKDFGMVPVGENDRLVGMLSDRDITIRAVARGLAPDKCKVRDVMTKDVKYVYEDESVADVSRNMRSRPEPSGPPRRGTCRCRRGSCRAGPSRPGAVRRRTSLCCWAW